MARPQQFLSAAFLALVVTACGGAGGSAGPTYTPPLPSGTFDAGQIDPCALLSANEFTAAVGAPVDKQPPAALNPRGDARVCNFVGQTVTGKNGQQVTNGGFVGFTVKSQTLDEFNAVYGQPLQPDCTVAPVQVSQYQTSAQAAYTQLCTSLPNTGDVGVWINGLSLLIRVNSGSQSSTSLLPSATNLAQLALQQLLTYVAASPS